MDLNIITNEASPSSLDDNVSSPKTPQNCPEWVKISEIPHPALVPNFISRRECLPDGSFDPNTPSVSLQMSLLGASNLSPSLVSVISSIPSGLMCESIHEKNLREAKNQQTEIEGFLLTNPPSHYKRTADPLMMPSSNSVTSNNNTNALAMANQTATELTAMNILYGGVKGKAYLDSLKSYSEGLSLVKDGKIDALMREKVEKCESVCGVSLFQQHQDKSDNEMNSSQSSLLDQNIHLFHSLNSCKNEADRLDLLNRLKSNLIELLRECPEEIKNEKLKGVNFEIYESIGAMSTN